MGHLPQYTNVIWLQTGFIGDIVLTTGACDLLAEEFPAIRQFAITTPVGEGVLEGCPHLIKRFIFRKRSKFFGLTAFNELKRQVIENEMTPENTVILQVHRSMRSSLLALFLGFPTVTYQETPLRIHASWKVPRVAVFHEMVRIGMVLQPYGIPRSKILRTRPRLAPLAIEDSSPLEFMKADKEFIAVAPGSIWGTKRWPSESFASLIRRILIERQQAQIVLLGSSQESELAHGIVNANSAMGDRIHNLVGKTSLADLRRIFPRLKLLIANDSSPIHYASAFSVGTVAIFGATIPEMGFGPVAPQSQVVGVNLPCRPCSDHGPQTCPLEHFQCMKSLTVDSVFKTCQDILKKLSS
jgi:heptosyltransferase-2